MVNINNGIIEAREPECKTEKAICKTHKVLLKAYNCSTERVVKALFLSNAGALIAIIAYFHRVPCSLQRNVFTAFYLILAAFILPIVVVVIDYLSSLCKLSCLKKKLKDLKENKIGVEQLCCLTHLNCSVSFIRGLLCLLSLLLLIAGSVVALNHFQPCIVS